MRRISNRLFVFGATLFLAACAGEMPIEKAIIGEWVQETPVSMTDLGLETTLSDGVLTLEKDGDARLLRLLALRGSGLPPEGVEFDIDISGNWILRDGQLVQTLEQTLITPRTKGDEAATLAEQLQSQSEVSPESVKAIIAADRKQLILQDIETGVTDVYRRR